MALTIEQKSAYLVILNATMILRSLGKTFKSNKKKLKNFKIKLFSELENLIQKMENNSLKENDIIHAIESLSRKCNISFGQSQKALNVLLKFHYYIYKQYLAKRIKQILHCPLDSVILNELGKNISLTSIDKKEYQNLQQEIFMKTKPNPKLDFDKIWDTQHLKEEGLLKY